MEERKIKEVEEEKNEKMPKKEIVRRRKRLRVSWQERRRRRLSQVLERKHHISWCRLRRTRNNTLLICLIFSRNWKSLFRLEKPCNKFHSTPSLSKIYWPRRANTSTATTLWWKAIVVLSSRGSFHQNIKIQGVLLSLAQLVLCQLEKCLLT